VSIGLKLQVCLNVDGKGISLEELDFVLFSTEFFHTYPHKENTMHCSPAFSVAIVKRRTSLVTPLVEKSLDFMERSL
jgi:hypothetical protein